MNKGGFIKKLAIIETKRDGKGISLVLLVSQFYAEFELLWSDRIGFDFSLPGLFEANVHGAEDLQRAVNFEKPSEDGPPRKEG